MFNLRCLLALPLVLAVTIGSADASSIRDRAGLFNPDAVRDAEAKLDRIERDNGIATTIETVDSLEGRPIGEVAIEDARRSAAEGIFILIPKQEHEIRAIASKHYAKALPKARLDAIAQAFISRFKEREFDAGLKDGIQAVGQEISIAKSANGGQLRRADNLPAAPAGRREARQGGNGFGLGSLLGIGLMIVAVLVGIRLLGSLFGGGRQQRAYGPGGQPGMGMGPGYGGGYGGGGGGGFMSSLFGGIGGAMAGNWLYDQFSGRHGNSGNYADSSAVPGGEATPTSGGDEWSGGSSATGDWGGGESGGGGDWGGGDSGGGGGDWGGGGGDGGSW